MKPRPERTSDEVWKRADVDLRKVLDKLECLQGDIRDMDEVIEVISQARELDGYKLAKQLEDVLLCDCCFQDADDLEKVEYIIRRHWEALVLEWVKTEGIVVPFKIGDKVKFTWRDQMTEGIVHQIDPSFAKLVINVEGKGGRPVINFEDVEKV